MLAHVDEAAPDEAPAGAVDGAAIDRDHGGAASRRWRPGPGVVTAAVAVVALVAAVVVATRPTPLEHTGSLLTTAGARASSVDVQPDGVVWRREVTTVPTDRPRLDRAGDWLLATAGATTTVLDPRDLSPVATLPAATVPAVGAGAVVTREGRALVHTALPDGAPRILATLPLAGAPGGSDAAGDVDVTAVAAWRDGAVVVSAGTLDALDGTGHPVARVDLAGLPAPAVDVLGVLDDLVVLADGRGGLHRVDLAVPTDGPVELSPSSGTSPPLVRSGALLVADDDVRDSLVVDLATAEVVARIPHATGDTAVRALDVTGTTVTLLAVRAGGALVARTHRRADGALLGVVDVRTPGGSASPFGIPPAAASPGVLTTTPTSLQLAATGGEGWQVRVDDLRGMTARDRAVLVTTATTVRVLAAGDGAELASWPLVARAPEAIRADPGLRPLLDVAPAGVVRRDAIAADGDGLLLDADGATVLRPGSSRYGSWLVDDVVLSVTSGSLRGTRGGGEAALLATGADGALRWSVPLTFDDLRTVRPVAAASGRVLVALPGTSSAVDLVALDLTTGREVGGRLSGLDVAALETRSGTRLLLSTADAGHGRRLTAVDLGDAGPRLVWDAPPLDRGQRLHVVAGPDGPALWEVGHATATPRDPATGRRGTPVPLPAGTLHAAAVDDRLLVTTLDRRLLALDATLTPVWDAVLPATPTAPPVVAGGEVLVGDAAGAVQRVDLADGTVRAAVAAGNRTDPVLAVGVLGRTMVVATARSLVALGPTLPDPPSPTEP
ncbi:MAG: PQQ-binding-like beta-propeller repeat protein [Actinomycetes bacterium]